MKYSYLLLSLTVLGSAPLYAGDPFADLDEEMALYEQESVGSAELEDSFQKYIEARELEYQTWQTQYLKEFDQFQNDLINKWGEGDVSQKDRNVEFSEDKNVKSVIDYQTEEVSIAVLVDKELSVEEAEKQVKVQVEKLLEDKQSNIARIFEGDSSIKDGKVSVSEVQYSEKKKLQMQDVIIKQTQAQAQEIDKKTDRAQLPDSPLTQSQSQQLAAKEKQQLLTSSQARINTATENYDKAAVDAAPDKKVVLYKVRLPKNSLARRAAKYSAYAEKEGQIREIPAALVMAIMHSESAFDPRAKSAVPAYGLMQIVPRTAGHDVNKLVRNIDKPMDKDDLYVPQINVETGTAYLDILDKRYLKAIKNDHSRLYCTIASYNTGAGNVARVFNSDGSRNINKAARIINKLTPDQVYQQLMAKLPYDETKHYLERVNSRIALYESKT
ncbi:transglycosylase SLT domain-containing protein [Psychromonas ossibalaenae]|uniref:transglycosylase SLT domain-containing protein n=1 Tax=Psychromonas ossibalaenae TaxID=444922 RepID=UPI00035EBA90|nr:transglycosylase SLT domain-containing protein [Psychromonas ossibalaenae]